MKNYYEINEFKDIYLEDSFVIQVIKTKDLIFVMDLVLTRGHYLYIPPKLNEQYCYKKGRIVFKNVSSIQWKNLNNEIFYNLNYNIDYGNIDKFIFFDECYYLEGDWGACTIYSDFPVVNIYE